MVRFVRLAVVTAIAAAAVLVPSAQVGAANCNAPNYAYSTTPAVGPVNVLGSRVSLYVYSGAAVTQGSGRAIETVWHALDTSNDTLIEVFMGVSSDGHWGMTASTLKWVWFVYLQGNGTTYWNWGNATSNQWHQIQLTRISVSGPTAAYQVKRNGINLGGPITGMGVSIRGLSAGSEVWYNGAIAFNFDAIQGSNQRLSAGNWVTGWPGGVSTCLGPPLYGFFSFGSWFNGF